MDKLLERLICGDMNAFNEMVEYYNKTLFYIALARTNDEVISKEAVQDTFICLYLHIKKLKNVKNFNSWIIKILINNCKKKYKKRNIVEVSYDSLDNEYFSHDEYDFENIVNDIDFFELINILNEDDRTIMALYYKDNYSTKEISEILGMNENTIRTRMRRAREIIKKNVDGGDKDGRKGHR